MTARLLLVVFRSKGLSLALVGVRLTLFFFENTSFHSPCGRAPDLAFLLEHEVSLALRAERVTLLFS
jgi:hypothetical protein